MNLYPACAWTDSLTLRKAHIFSVANMSRSYLVVAKFGLMIMTFVKVSPQVTVDETDSCGSDSLDEVVSLMSNEFKEVKDLLSSNSLQTADSYKQVIASLLQCKRVSFYFVLCSLYSTQGLSSVVQYYMCAQAVESNPLQWPTSPPSGTTCLSTSHLRRHSRFSDNDSRPFCFPLRNDLYCVEWGVKLYSLTPLHKKKNN